MATRIKKITIGTPITTPAATFLAFDSGNVLGLVDSAYIQSRQITYDIDSAYVQARQITYNVLDSINVQNIVNSYGYSTTDDIDSAFVQARQLNFNLSQGVGLTNIDGHLVPTLDSTYSLGAPGLKFKDLYLSGNTLNLGNLLLKAQGNTLLVQDQSGEAANLDAVNYTDLDVLALVDSAYIQSRQAGLDSQGTTISFGRLTVGDSTLTAEIVNDAISLSAGTHITLTPDVNNMSVEIASTAIDSSQVRDLVDSAYIQSRQNLSTYGDSNVIQLVDSDYVAARTPAVNLSSYATETYVTNAIDSVVGAAPGALDTLAELATALGNDSNFSTTVTNLIATKIDSTGVINIVDSAYINSKVVIPVAFDSANALAAVDGINISTFTNDVNYTTYDSVSTIGLVDSDYVQARVTFPASSTYDSNNTTSLIDSAYVQARQITYGDADVLQFVDSAYVQARQNLSTYNDSNVQLFVDSAYVQARQNLSTYGDSNVQLFIDSDYVRARQITYNVLDSSVVLNIVDSAHVSAHLDAETVRQKSGVLGYSFADIGLGYPVNVLGNFADPASSEAADTYFYGNVQPLLNQTYNIGSNAGRFSEAYIQTLYVGDVIPHSGSTYDLGKANRRFKTAHLDANTLNLGGLLLQAQEDAETGGINLSVSDDSTAEPTPIPNSNQVIQIADSNLATNSKLENISNVDDSPYAGATLVYDGGFYVWRNYHDSNDIHNMFTGGTGVEYSSGEFSIGQPVGTTDNVTFNDVTVSGSLNTDDVTATTVTASGDVVVQGDLIVNGTTTTVNSNEVNIGDAVILLNSDEEGTPSQNAGIEIERGTQGNVSFLWDEVNTQWTIEGETFDAGFVRSFGGFQGNLAGNVTGTVSDISNHNTDSLSEGSTNLYYTDTRVRASISAAGDLSYDSSTGEFNYTQPADVSAFNNDANYTTYDSSNTLGLIDSAYITARVATGTDSNAVVNIVQNTVDSAYINTKLDLPESGIDSASVIGIIDSAYINSKVTIPEAFDSNNVISIVDSTYVQSRETPQDFAYSSLTGAPELADVATSGDYADLINTPSDAAITTDGISVSLTAGASGAEVRALIGAGTSNLDSADVSEIAGGTPAIFVDGLTPALNSFIDAGEIRDLIGASTFKGEYDSLSGAPSPAILVDGLIPVLDNVISGQEVRDLIGAVDSAFVRENSGVDSTAIINIINSTTDSAYVQLRQDYDYSSLTGSPSDLSEFTNSPGYIKTEDLEDIDITSYVYTAASTTSSVTGIDDNGNTLAYIPGQILVYLNGVKLIETEDYTATNGTSVGFIESAVTGDIIEIVKYTGQVLTDDAYISISELKSIVASSTTFADFKIAVAGL